MANQRFNPRNIVLLLIIIVIAVIRVLNNYSPQMTALANYSPLVAITLFGSAYFNGVSKPLLLPLAIIFISDIILFSTVYKEYGNGILYDGWLWVYSAFVLMAITGKLIIKKVTVQRVSIAAIVSVFIHWIVTDFGVWLDSTTYAQTFTGFMECLNAAIPFELRLITATVVYGIIMFGVFEFMKNKYPVLKTA